MAQPEPVAPLPEPTEEVVAQSVEATPVPIPTPVPASSSPGQLSESEMRALYAEAGVPPEWVEPMLIIARCESNFRPGAIGDSGNSLGLHQLWRGWAHAAGYVPDDLMDPLINTKVALYVRETRGRFGGSGGWTCAGLNGIP